MLNELDHQLAKQSTCSCSNYQLFTSMRRSVKRALLVPPPAPDTAAAARVRARSMFDDDEMLDVDLDAVLGVDPEPARLPPAVYNSRRHRVVCKHWLNGMCKKGDDCDFLHKIDHDRMPECFHFSQFGECNNKECLFKHIRPDEKTDECPWYARGFCKHGPRCRHRHTTKKPCPKYLAGLCPDGAECTFGHPKYELPSMVGSLVVPRAGATQFERDMAITCYKCWQKGHFANRCPNARVAPPAEMAAGAAAHEWGVAPPPAAPAQPQTAQQNALRMMMGTVG